MKTKELVYLAILTALSLILFIVENLFPPIFPFAPGTKLGLSNIILLFILIKYDYKDALIVLIVRCLLSALFTNFFSIYYSLISGLVSVTLMWVLYRFIFPKIGVVAISVTGAVIFNIVQLFLASMLYKTYVFLYYVPWTVLVSFIAGSIVGLAIWLIIKYLPNKFLI